MNVNTLHRTLPLPMRYVLAVGIFFIALLLRFWILPVESGLAYLTFYPAMVVTFYLCGVGPGMLMVALSAATGYYIFIPPFWSSTHRYEGDVAASIFLVSAFLIALVVKQLQTYAEQFRITSIALQQSEQRYRGVLEDQSELICRYKADDTILYVNDAFCRFFGKSRDALVGRQWHPVVWHDDVAQVNERLSMLSPENPAVTIENRVVASGGVVRWGQFVNRAFFDEQGRLKEIQSIGRDITERKELDSKLAALAAENEDLYDQAPCGYHSLGPDGTYLRINAKELAWLGCKREDVIGKMSPLDFIATPEGIERFKHSFAKFMSDGHIEDHEFDLVGRDGTLRHFILSATAIKDADDKFLTSRSVLYDITKLKEVEKQLKELTLEQHLMLDNELVGIVKVRDRHVVWQNRAMNRIYGYEAGELFGKSTRILYPDDLSFEAVGAAAYPTLSAQDIYRTQLEMVRKDGERIWVDISGVLLSEQDRESMWMMVDITSLRKQQEQIERLAHHDILTGLPNRLLLSDRLIQASAQAERAQRMLAVCYLDLDGFKPVNDSFGHAAGDQLLREAAHRMQASIRAHDSVFRLGGDEFVLLLTNLESVEEYQLVLQRVVTEINKPFVLDETREANVTASVGITLFPSDNSGPDALLRHADQAMYQAKRLGRNQVCLYRAGIPAMVA